MKHTYYRPFYDAIGRKLRYHRRRRGVSQTEIAKYLGMSRQRYSRIEQRPGRAPKEIQEQINEFLFRGGYKLARAKKAEQDYLDSMMEHPYFNDSEYDDDEEV